MDAKTEKLFQRLKSKKIGVFCDDSNLYHSYQKYGWRVDFGKFRDLLRNYCDLQFVNYYLVIPEKNDHSYRGTMSFLDRIKSYVEIKKKEMKYTPVGGQLVKKGNVDVEITLDIVRRIDALDAIMIMSGDSDFHELKNFVVKEKGKNIIFIGYEENMAWELRQCWHIYLNRIRDAVELKE